MTEAIGSAGVTLSSVFICEFRNHRVRIIRCGLKQDALSLDCYNKHLRVGRLIKKIGIYISPFWRLKLKVLVDPASGGGSFSWFSDSCLPTVSSVQSLWKAERSSFLTSAERGPIPFMRVCPHNLIISPNHRPPNVITLGS